MMITIQYADLPEGSHVLAAERGRHTVIYLRPGLTPQQRRQGLRRARQSGRMGYGPRMTAAGVAVALCRCVVQGTLQDVGAAVRMHPWGFGLVVIVGAAGMVCYAMLVTASLRAIIPHAPQPRPIRGTNTVAGPAVPGQARAPAPGIQPGAGVPGWVRSQSPSPRASRHVARPGSTVTPSPTPGQPGPSPSPATPSPSPLLSPSPTPSPSCLRLGPLGICLSL
jgi:hypothetical protein